MPNRTTTEDATTCATCGAVVTCSRCGEPCGTCSRCSDHAREPVTCDPCGEDAEPGCEFCGDSEPVATIQNRRGEDALACSGCAESRGFEHCEDCGDWTRGTCSDCAPRDPEPYGYAPAPAPTLPEHKGRPYTVGIEIEAILPAYPDDWELTDDASVSDYGGRETVSPILTGSRGMEFLAGAVRTIAANGSEPVENGGTHVHVGAGSLTVAELIRVFRAWSTWGEDVFSGMVPGDRWTCGYCRPQHGSPWIANTIAEWAESSPRVRLTDPVSRWAEDIGDTFDPYGPTYRARLENGDRYVSLNPCALSKHGTIEFRLFPSSVDSETVTTWAALCARFVHVARSTEPARVRAILDGFGTLRAGLRILSRGCDSLRTSAEHVATVQARAIPSRYSTRADRDPWGKDAKRKTLRKGSRRASRTVTTDPATPGGTPFLFPVPERDKGPEDRPEPEPLACHCERATYETPSGFVHCPAHGLPEFGCAGLPLGTREGVRFPEPERDDD